MTVNTPQFRGDPPAGLVEVRDIGGGQLRTSGDQEAVEPLGVNAEPNLTPFCCLGSRVDSSDRRNDDPVYVASPWTCAGVRHPRVLRGLVLSA